jgi:hypothetical protein
MLLQTPVGLSPPRLGLPELFVCPDLRGGELADDGRQSDKAFIDAAEPLRQARLIPGAIGRHTGNICGELRLLVQQKLHRALQVLRRHRLKIHEKTSNPTRFRHYAIVHDDGLSKKPAARGGGEPARRRGKAGRETSRVAARNVARKTAACGMTSRRPRRFS